MNIKMSTVGLRYKTKDAEKLIDVFSSISDKKDNPMELLEEVKKIADYPLAVIVEFLKCMEVLSAKEEDYLRKNYSGVIGYITLRLNMA